MKLFFSLLLLSVCLKVQAQAGDYLIIDNDSVYGQITDRNDEELLRKIRIELPHGKTKKYKRERISTYTIGDKIYVRKEVHEALLGLIPSTTDELLQVVEEGPVSLYKLEFNDFDTDVIDWVYLVKKENQKLYQRLPFIFYKSRAKALLRDCPELREVIDNSRYTDIPDLISQYNNCVGGVRI